MRRVIGSIFVLAWFGVAIVNTAYAQAPPAPGRVGIRFGAGTDISGGIAYGGQIDYTLFQGTNAVELGLAVFGGSFSEDSNNGFNDYHEETDVLVVGVVANYMFRHSMDTPGPYYTFGAGVGAFSVEWREESPTDVSLGQPLPGGGSFQEEDGGSAGAILSFGIGNRFTEQIDLRFQVPTFFISSGDSRDSQVIPTFTLTLGVGF